jgi:CheY-like chemotaxis protein
MASGPRSLRILVADDDPLNLRIAARLLRELGHTGSLVTDGHKALALLAQQRFDLMLLDISMPELDGLETLQRLRSAPPAGPRLPVLMVSGHTDDATRDHFLAAGADGFLSKPLASTALQAEIQRICRV